MDKKTYTQPTVEAQVLSERVESLLSGSVDSDNTGLFLDSGE